jgi:hypothetical protein
MNAAGENGHEPLSKLFLRLANELPVDQPVTLNRIIDQVGPRGPFGVLIVLSLPFITPVALPGVSNVLGVVMIVIAWRLARGKPAHLPKRAGERRIPRERMAKILRISEKVLRFIERFVRPRRTPWLAWRGVRVVNAGVIALMALMLALPIPPTIPLSNMLPSYGVILMAMSLMEEDGWLIWAAYAVSLGTAIYLTAMTVLQAEAIAVLYTKYFDRIISMFR